MTEAASSFLLHRIHPNAHNQNYNKVLTKNPLLVSPGMQTGMVAIPPANMTGNSITFVPLYAASSPPGYPASPQIQYMQQGLQQPQMVHYGMQNVTMAQQGFHQQQQMVYQAIQKPTVVPHSGSTYNPAQIKPVTSYHSSHSEKVCANGHVYKTKVSDSPSTTSASSLTLFSPFFTVDWSLRHCISHCALPNWSSMSRY